MRGEHANQVCINGQLMGSSPHARGAQVDNLSVYGLAGIIPACAGSTRPKIISDYRARDHPRMRGEHTDTPSATQRDAGSSPHARGALVAVPLVGEQRGIIPACAGSTNAADVSFVTDGIIPACAGST